MGRERRQKRKHDKHGSTSQTQDPGYNSVLFRSEGCEKFHSLIIGDQGFVKEKAIILAPGECDEMRDNIIARGWEEYVVHPKKASQALVFEFFSNVFPKFDIDGPVKFKGKTSYVRGHTIPFDCDTINEVLGLRPTLILDCFLRNPVEMMRLKKDQRFMGEVRDALCIPGADWVRNASGEPQKIKTKHLTPVAKGWASFIVSTILPSPCHTELSFERAILAATIIRGEPVNLGWVIEKEIKEFAEFKKGKPAGYWKYASLVARLCESVGVVAEPGEATTELAAPIDVKWLHSKGLLEYPVYMEEPQQGQQEQPVEMEQPQQEQPDEHEPAFNIEDLVGPSAEDFQNLRGRVDMVVTNQEQMMAAIEQIRITQADMIRNQRCIRRAQERIATESRFERRALYRALASMSGGQLDPDADIFHPPQPPQPPQQ